MVKIVLAATLVLVSIVAQAQTPVPPPDPAAVQAALRMELGKAQFEAGQFQAALVKAQARVAELEKAAKEKTGAAVKPPE